MRRSGAGYLLAVGEAVCMPLQGALNAAVYGWSLPSIRRGARVRVWDRVKVRVRDGVRVS